MAERKQALLIFSKPPLPGIVKTRMTKEYGGFLTLEQAAAFYKVCFYDVCEMGMHALIELQERNTEKMAEDPEQDKIVYDFFISTTPAESLPKVKEVFDKIGPWPMEINYLVDTGSSFDEHFNDAFKQLFDMGYENIVSIGGDVPTMPKEHVKGAFQWLEYFRHYLGKPGFVQAPCQECGTSLVGFSCDTPIDHDGIYYNMDGRPALDGYVEKLQEAGDIPSAYFDPVADIDEITDLAHAISCMKAIREAAKYQPHLFVPHRTLTWVELMGLRVSTPPNENHDPRDYLDGKVDASDASDAYDASDALEGEAPTSEDKQRIEEGMAAIRDAQKAENAYERGKYE